MNRARVSMRMIDAFIGRAFSPCFVFVSYPGAPPQADMGTRFQRSCPFWNLVLRAEGPASYQPGAKPQE